MKGKKHKNTLLRIKKVCELTQQHYEPGRQDRSYKSVWRKFVYPIYPMHYRTYLKYINTPLPKEKEPDDPNQTRLQF